jgi:hypothetical protein
MKKRLNYISFTLFLIAAISYFTVFIGIDELLLIAAISSAFGFIIALFGDRGKVKKISIFGNAMIIFLSVIMPLVITTFFWNSP